MKVTLIAKSQVCYASIALLRPRPRKEERMGDTPFPRQLLYFPAGALNGSDNLQS
jgi:hypothetical protein